VVCWEADLAYGLFGLAIICGLAPILRGRRMFSPIRRVVIGSLKTLAKLSPFTWRGFPIGWRGFPKRKRSEALVIIDAVYGAHGKEQDVTRRLNGLVSNGVLDIIVDNLTMGGDPAEGQEKTLRIRWEAEGEPGASSFSEGTHMVVP
jgi:hypothetical protein